MKGILFICALSCMTIGGIASVSVIDFPSVDWKLHPNLCEEVPKGRVPWILHARNPDYGWGENTHRANIALAVNRYRGENLEEISEEDIKKMGLQLEVEVTTALFRNESSKIHENDLALYIHALLATGKNPRAFHCTDLVGDLLHRVESAIREGRSVHPFLVLALCNSRAVTQDHLETITSYTEQHRDNAADRNGRQTELKALSLKAYACAARLSRSFDKFRTNMNEAEDYLIRRQKQIGDGSFGNVYTTSLAVQALTASRTQKAWDKQKALAFLERESTIQVNMIKAYYIEMALNAASVNFIKDLYKAPLTRCDVEKPTSHFIQYTIKNSKEPDFFFSLTMKVAPKSNFFDIMEKAYGLNDRFSLNYTLNTRNLPMVHTVSGTPNDAEENMFWRICRQTEVKHYPHGFSVTTFRESPRDLILTEDEHVILWYLDGDCRP